MIKFLEKTILFDQNEGPNKGRGNISFIESRIKSIWQIINKIGLSKSKDWSQRRYEQIQTYGIFFSVICHH